MKNTRSVARLELRADARGAAGRAVAGSPQLLLRVPLLLPGILYARWNAEARLRSRSRSRRRRCTTRGDSVKPTAFGALFSVLAAAALRGGVFNANLANPLSHSY